ncbi:TPA: LbtU family siderophore porin, partial [bacterium]|nr:LbtU family siderophore porin [bacterium]
LGVDATLNNNLSGKILLLYEQGENNENIAVDEGFITIGLPIELPFDFSFSLGRMGIPFGEFNSHFVTDSYSLEIGEKKNVALLASIGFQEIIDLSVALYNENIYLNQGDDHINDMASRLALTLPEGDISLSLGGSFITNMAGTDGLADMIGDSVLLEKAMGIGGFISLGLKGIFLEAEYISALEDIKIKGEDMFKPQTFNIELGYSIPNTPVKLAGKFERYKETSDQSIDRFGGLISFDLYKDMSNFALEFLRTNDGESSENSIIGQLSISF